MATSAAAAGPAGSSSETSTPPPPPAQARKRISYILPAVEGDPPQWYRLPSLDEAMRLKKARSTPLLYPAPPESYNSSVPISSKNPFRALIAAENKKGMTTRSHPRHVLPVSSLALDATTVLGGPDSDGVTPKGILYTGGRDGLVGAWELGLEMRRRDRGRAPAAATAAAEEQEEQVVEQHQERERSGWQAMQPRASSRTGRKASSSPAPAKFRHKPLTIDVVISASSDGVLKAWSPHDSLGATTPQMLGSHRDYIKALAHAPHAGWVASGGFDKTVKLWDIGQSRAEPIVELPETLVKSSVYALSTNPAGTVIAGGSPEKIVRVWDPRSRQQVSQLVGHTDNVRSVVVSHDGRHLLSASSDCTIRLWSLAEQRCLHTFTHHDDSVWSLFSDHADLDVFYSGDRAGYVCKVDWERCAEVSEGECVVLARESGLEAEQQPFSQSPAAGAAGIHKIVALDDAYFWTASATSRVSRWRDVPRRSEREALYPIHRPSVSSMSGAGPSAPPATDMVAKPSAFRQQSSQPMASNVSFVEPTAGGSLSGDTAPLNLNAPEPVPSLYGIPFDSLVCLAPPDDPLQAAIGLGSVSLRQATSNTDQQSRQDNLFSSASLISIPSALRSVSGGHKNSFDEVVTTRTPLSLTAQHRPASIRFAASSPPADAFAEAEEEDEEEEEDQSAEEVYDTKALEARQAYEERELVAEAKPVNEWPDDSIEGSHGLIRSSMLNDRRHVLTVDTAGTVFVWDIVSGRCLGGIKWQDIRAAAAVSQHAERQLLPNEALEVVKERIEGEAAVPLWCTVDTKIGRLTVHLEHPRCFDAELYLDECTNFMPDVSSNCKEDQRANAGKWVLRNLFGGFVDVETKLRNGDRPQLNQGTLALEKPEIARSAGLRLNLPGSTKLTGFASPSEKMHTPGMTIALAVAPKTPALVPKGATALTPTVASVATLPALAELVSSVSTRNGNGATGADYFSLQTGQSQQANAPTTPLSRSASTVKTPTSTDAMPQSPSAGSSGLMGRLRMGLGSSKNKNSAAAIAAANHASAGGNARAGGASSTDESDSATTENAHLTWLRHILSRPVNAPSLMQETPAINYDGQTALLISESPLSQLDSTGAWQVVYRGLVSTTSADVEALELLSPTWLVDFLLTNRLSLANNATATTQASAKISFTLQPWKLKAGTSISSSSSTSSPQKHDEDGAKEEGGVLAMPAMPSG
ncbi:hypothetical protein L7F22_002482 [Adiantum nelumboides]|nr:hypothetical protein [Adiantum nelumboides]